MGATGKDSVWVVIRRGGLKWFGIYKNRGLRASTLNIALTNLGITHSPERLVVYSCVPFLVTRGVQAYKEITASKEFVET